MLIREIAEFEFLTGKLHNAFLLPRRVLENVSLNEFWSPLEGRKSINQKEVKAISMMINIIGIDN